MEAGAASLLRRRCERRNVYSTPPSSSTRPRRWHEGSRRPTSSSKPARRLNVPAALRRGRGLGNGLRAAHAAGMHVIAIPNRRYPPPDDALALADVVLESVGKLDIQAFE